MYYNLLIIFVTLLLTPGCANTEVAESAAVEVDHHDESVQVKPGAWQTELYLPILKGKKVSLVVNHTSTIGPVHLVDSLLALNIDIRKIFAPEHGFRGKADAGEHVSDEQDPKTGLSIVSLYGAKRGPSPQDLEQTDVVVFDIQDVGARFYTYISTMHYVMTASAKANIPVLIFDRPNPNGHYVDGPIREDAYKSFVGMHPVPIVYGMTIGEYAQMINGEGWLDASVRCQLQVIPVGNYDHQTMYDLPIAPSPNLPNLRSILRYPSLCFFEGTPLSIGRGTKYQFQVIGHPDLLHTEFSFTPQSMFGAAKPKLMDQLCYGETLQDQNPADIFEERKINLSYLIKYYELFPDKTKFFNENKWIDKLAGTAGLREALQSGKTEDQIRQSWQEDLRTYSKIRSKYLIYR